MSYFAQVQNGVVTQVISAEQSFIDTLDNPSDWIQTSYNTHNGVHYGQDGKPDGGIALRGNYAGVGFIYDKVNDVFYQPQPFASWTISAPTWEWQSPVPRPNDGKVYQWDERALNWVLMPLV
jgi:hypothetical protein